MEYAPGATAESIAELGTGALRRAAVEGDTQNGCVMAGQIAGLVTCEQTAAQIISDVIAQAEILLKGASQWVK
jgi:enoyl-[acyl-carrier protein] reductase II